jgi:parvulin-like peptidyl-prolyl isomerase
MNRYLISLLLILSSAILGGCGEGLNWFKFSQPKPQVKIKKPLQVSPPAQPKPAQPKLMQPRRVQGTVLATVNRRIITLEDFTARIDMLNKDVYATEGLSDKLKEANLIRTVDQKKDFLRQMEDEQLLVSEAIDRGIGRDKDVARAIRVFEEQLLMTKMLEAEKAKIVISSQEVNDFYNSNKVFFLEPEERKVSVIVVPGEDKGKEILMNLWQGGDFAALARANSRHESAGRGGDIGFIVPQMPFPQPGKKIMFEKFEEVAFSLGLNKDSMLFKGPDGFYIIRVTQTMPSRQKPVAEVYNDIEQALLIKKQTEALDALLGNLRKAAKIVVNEKLLTN